MRGPPIVTLAAGAIPNGHSVRGAVVVLKRSIRGPTETYEASRGCTGRTAGPGPGRCRDRDQLARCPGARLGGPAHHTGRLQRHQPVIVILRDAVQGLEGGRSPLRPRAVIYPAVLADRTPGRVLTAATVLYASVWKVAFLLPKNGEDEPQGGLTLVVLTTFCYLILWLMAETPILADWLNKRWQAAIA